MSSFKKNMALSFLLVLFALISQAQEDAEAIFKKATEKLLFENMEMSMEVKSMDKKGRVKEKGFDLLVAKFDDTVKTKMSLQKPERAKGTTIVFTQLPNDEGLIEVYMPANGKIRKMKATPDNLKMVGSEFNFTNFASQDADELEFNLLGKVEKDGKSYDKIQVESREIKDDGKGEIWIDQKSKQIGQIMVFDSKGNLQSQTFLSDYQPVEGHANKSQPMFIKSEDFKDKSTSEIKILSIKPRKDLTEDNFQLPKEKVE